MSVNYMIHIKCMFNIQLDGRPATGSAAPPPPTQAIFAMNDQPRRAPWHHFDQGHWTSLL